MIRRLFLMHRLPALHFSSVRSITLIETHGKGGKMVAELDIRLDAWYFQCHMLGCDPGSRIPGGCNLSSCWFLLRLAESQERRPGLCRQVPLEVRSSGHIIKMVRYEIDVRRLLRFEGIRSSVVAQIGFTWIMNSLPRLSRPV